MGVPDEIPQPPEPQDSRGGGTDRRLFAMSLATASVIALLVTVLVATTPIALAGITISDVGGFRASFERVDGTDVTFYPAVGESSACPDDRADKTDPDPALGEDALPLVRTDIGSAEIAYYDDISVTKDIGLPNAIPGIAGVRINLTRPTNYDPDGVQLGDASIALTRIDAERIELDTNVVIDDRYDAGQTFGDPDYVSDPGGEFIFGGDTATIEGAEITAHLLSFQNLSFPDGRLDVEYITDETELRVDQGSCPVRGAQLLPLINATAPSPASPGDNVTVEVLVENPGATSESGFLSLDADGSQQDSEYITVAGGSNATFDLFWDTDASVARGEYDLLAYTSDGDDTETLLIGDPATFTVTIDDTTSPVKEGDDLLVNATISNAGDTDGEQQVALALNGTTRDATTVALNASESTQQTFSWTTSDGDAGDYLANVSSEDDADTANVTVDPSGPYYSVNITGNNSPVVEGDKLNVTANVTNLGDAAGTKNVTLDIFYDNASAIYESAVDAKELSLGAGSSTTATWTWDSEIGDKGDWIAAVRSPDDGDGTNVTLTEASRSVFFAINDLTTNSPVQEGDTLEVTAEIENTGDQQGTQDAVLTLDGVEEDNTTLTLSAGQLVNETFTWTTTVGDNASYTATVSTQNDSLSTGVTVEAQGDYDPIQGDSSYEWLDRVAYGTVDETSGDNGGYANFTNHSTQVQPLDTLSVTAYPASGGSWTENVSFWVDWDRNYDFAESERVYLGGCDTNCSLSGSVTVPDDAALTETRMRVKMCWSGDCGEPTDPYDTSFSGEAEDYSVDVQSRPADFAVTVTGTNEPVQESETLNVTARIENLGDVQDTQTIALDLDGTQEDSTSVTLGRRELTTVTLQWPTTTGDNGTYTATVASADDSDTASVEIFADGTYDGSVGDSSFEWIERVTAGGEIDETSGENGGYADFTNRTVNVTDGDTLDQTVFIEASGGYTEHASTWVDWDRNFDFEGWERTYFGSCTANCSLSDTLTVPTNATLTQTRLRTQMQYSTEPTDPYADGFYGETEDYAVRVINATITDFTQLDTGTYESGTNVSANVTVRNDADVAHTFFVGFSVRDPDGTLRDNGGSTGGPVTLAGGELRNVTVTWEVEGGAPAGDYDSLSSVWLERDRANLNTRLDDAEITKAFSVDTNLSLPLRTETDFQELGGTFNDASNGNVQYSVDNSRSSIENASGRFETQGTSDAGYGEVVVPSVDLSGEDWLTFEYNATSLTSSYGEAEVYVGSDLVWSTTQDTATWNITSVDVSGYTGTHDISLRLASPSGTGVSGRSINYDNVRLTNDSRLLETPFRTETDFQDLGVTFEDPGGDTNYTVDTTTSTVEGASGELCTAGTSGTSYGQVSWSEDLSGVEALTFNATGNDLDASWAAAQVYVGGDLVWERESDFSWEHQVIDVSGYTSEVEIAFRIDARGTSWDTRCWNVDDVQLESSLTAALSTPFRTQSDFQNLGETFEDPGGDVDYTVDTTTSTVEGASGNFSTAGTGGTSYGEVSWTEDLTGSDSLVFNATASNLDTDWAAAQVYVGGDLVWERVGDFGWEEQVVDVSGYSSTVDIEFRLDARGTGLDSREWHFDNVRLESASAGQLLETPFRTETDFTNLGETFVDTGAPDTGYTVDTSNPFVAGASGNLSTTGSGGSNYGEVSWSQDLSGDNVLEFFATGSTLDPSWAAAQVYVDGNLEWERASTFDWDKEEIDVSGYSSTVDIAFRLDARGTGFDYREWNFDDITTSDVLTYRTQPDMEAWNNTFNDTSSGNVFSEVATANSTVGGASIKLETNGNSGAGYGEVVIQDVGLDNANSLSFDALCCVGGSGWSGSYGYPSVHVGGTEVWSATDETNYGTWNSTSVDLSGYTGTQDISFRFNTPSGTGVSGRSVNYDNVTIGY